ncbi:MAG: hypothetical protein J6I73_05050 [Treponema sp.]|nr:hypothetical protein [Treponema sp.]
MQQYGFYFDENMFMQEKQNWANTNETDYSFMYEFADVIDPNLHVYATSTVSSGKREVSFLTRAEYEEREKEESVTIRDDVELATINDVYKYIEEQKDSYKAEYDAGEYLYVNIEILYDDDFHYPRECTATVIKNANDGTSATLGKQNGFSLYVKKFKK